MKKISLFCFILFVLAAQFANAATIWSTTLVGYYGTNANITGYSINSILGAPDTVVTDVGTADGAIWNNYLTVSFGTWFQDGAGNDVLVHLSDLDVGESFKVYVSANNIDWYLIGSTSTSTSDLYPSGASLGYDMAGCGISLAQYVKVLTNESDAAWSGPDLDAIGVTCPVPEPGTWLLGMLGIAAAWIMRRK